MSKPLNLQLRVADPDNILSPYMHLYEQHFSSGRYGSNYTRRSTACVLHFGTWLQLTGLEPSAVEEQSIGQFLHEHLRACSCDQVVSHDRNLNRAALNTLLRLLRANGVVDAVKPDLIEQELAAFDAGMAEVSRWTKDQRL